MQTWINRTFYGLFLFTWVFGILLYTVIGFDYTDECCALVLFLLFGYYIARTPDWPFNKAFLLTLGIFVFYLSYSFYIRSNSAGGILYDFIIQIKPYLAFFCVYAMAPRFGANRKAIIQTLSVVIWGVLLCIGIGDLFVSDLIYTVMGHPAYYAAAVVVTSFCYLYCSRFSGLNRVVFLALLSIGLFSGRAKFYGFYVSAVFILVFLSTIRRLRLNLKTIIVSLLMLGAVLFVAREKIYFYFVQTVTEEIDREMVARYILYVTSPKILQDYFPFGSGLGSFGTYASGLYYSDIYVKYGIDRVWGISQNYYNFIADTYYPSLAQFGVVGILLYLTFWFYILRKGYRCYRRTGNIHYLTLVILITGFFAIEGTTDSTFTTHRGFFTLMLLGMILRDMKQEQQALEHRDNT